MIAWIIAGCLVMASLWAIFIYNRFVTIANDVKNAWSQIDVQLKRRYDLVPNLVAAVKGYMEYEKQVIEKVATARMTALSVNRIRDKAAAEDGLSHELNRLFALMEGYPDLKANQHVMRLQEELVSTENRIAFSRQLYNDLVANFMTRREVFPDQIIAALLNIREMEYFSVDHKDRSFPAAKEFSRP